jgi:5-methylcytosine-specific restriction endonuclease McrA
MRGASITERFDAAEIYERDGWTCALCGRPIDRNLSYPDRLSASLDHIVPVSKGGQHTRENTQAAHFTCNTSKRDRLGISDDLPLG